MRSTTASLHRSSFPLGFSAATFAISPTSVLVRVDGTESLTTGTQTVEAIRVRTTYHGSALVVLRWFARGIGLAKMEVLGGSRTFRVRLLRFGSS